MTKMIKAIERELNLSAEDIQVLERELPNYDLEDISLGDVIELADEILWMNDSSKVTLTSKILD